ncbi:MAG: Zn-finger nucleic acid-binding protein [Bacteriovoracaceae bacterium]|jgi:Zn-finger nucleic acid-binding protein
MECPRCLSDKIAPFNHEGVEFDFCSSCHGIWTDKGELSNYVETRNDLPQKSNLLSEGRQTELNCPKCPETKLIEIPYLNSEDLLLDKCPTCKGIWLDSKELGSVQKLAQNIDKGHKVHLALKHVLSKTRSK